MKEDTGLEILGKLFSGLLLTTIGLLYYGWILKLFWGWFIAPAFSCVSLSFGASIGLAIVISFITSHTDHEKRPWGQIMKRWFNSVMHATVYLSIGWITHFFI